MLGGVGENQEHCMALLTYKGVSSVLECRSQPTDVSMAYALDLTLQGGGDEYVDYTNEIEDAFESASESTDYDVFGKKRKRRRRQTSNGEQVVDSFLDDVFTDQGLTVRDALIQMSFDSVKAAKINEALVRLGFHLSPASINDDVDALVKKSCPLKSQLFQKKIRHSYILIIS